jgi:sRNA-binding regulator protein Hfq
LLPPHLEGDTVRHDSSLPREFDELKRRTDAQGRGYAFEAFIGKMFQAEHFRVERKSRGTRQIDLFATLGNEVYLVETKWRKGRVNINDVESLFTRLESKPSSVIGLLVSYSGFTAQVRDKVREKSHRPVLLVSGRELEGALGWRCNFIVLLRQKKEALLIHREVLLDAEPKRRIKKRRTMLDDLPRSDTKLLFPDGRRSHWWASNGDFGKFAFVAEMPDIDWVPTGGFGVTADIVIPLDDQDDFLELLHQLAEMNWMTGHGTWSIQQATVNWHGFGAQALGEALVAWKERYKGLETHHTEELCYFEEIDDGFYTLTAAITADDLRIVWQAELSFQLVGIPLDLMPLRELCDRLGVRERIHFRPRSEKSVERSHPPRNAKRRSVTPIGFVVSSPDSGIGEDSKWVSGIVVENPFRRKRGSEEEWIPDMLGDSQYLICSLRSWHQVDTIKSVYEFWEFESAWSSDALIVRAIADWADDQDKGTPTLSLRAKSFTAKHEEVEFVQSDASDAHQSS